jgi:hypothetical protein
VSQPESSLSDSWTCSSSASAVSSEENSKLLTSLTRTPLSIFSCVDDSPCHCYLVCSASSFSVILLCFCSFCYSALLLLFLLFFSASALSVILLCFCSFCHSSLLLFCISSHSAHLLNLMLRILCFSICS